MNLDFSAIKPSVFSSTAMQVEGEVDSRSRPRGSMDPMAMFPLPQFMTIVPNEQHNRIELHLRGEFNSPQENTRELAELYRLAESVPTLMIYINSPGGRVDLMLELFTIMDKFRHTITVVCSEAASAGFMLWARGDIRVVQPHSELMAHRESYGFYGKTSQHEDNVVAKQKRFTRIYTEVTEGILTDEEFERSKYTEITLSDEDALERGCAISWEQFNAKDTEPVEHFVVVKRDDEMYIDANGLLMPVELSTKTEAYDPMEVMYGIENKENMLESALGELGMMLSGATESVDLDIDVRDEDDITIRNKDELRTVLREQVGKNRFALRGNGDVTIRPDKEHLLLGTIDEILGLTYSQIIDKIGEVIEDAANQ
ncbi:MAG: hypothetical protein CMF22_12000 [Idiomarinaceae bacterium]|nr:hypothetical protein [Idiomarinaceae bacterium]|tara:strand:+ start:14199 stop:15311 length:1113 start_codon:yes stop_codon:yes gene_type:complete